MSLGNKKTKGNQGESHSFQHNLLVISGQVANNTATLSTEATLQLLQNTAEIIAELTNDALGGEGTEYIFGTTAVTGKAYKYLVVNSDTGASFSTLNDDAAVDLLTDLGIGANAVTKGMIIRAKAGKLIEDITLATGSVVGIL
jgi:hypothetical protein